MGIMRNVHRGFGSIGRDRVVVEGSFRPNGATGVVSGSQKGTGWSVARTSAGLYTVTFDDFGYQLDSFFCSLREAAKTPTIVQAGDVSVANKTAQIQVLQAATAAVTPSAGVIPLPLGAFQEQDGTALADFSAGPTPGWSAGDESGGIRWGAHANPDPVSTQIVWPHDVDVAFDVVLYLLAAKTGATVGDAVVWVVEAFNTVNGALYDGDADYGGESSAMVGDATAKTVQELLLTLSAADLPAAVPSATTLTIQPKDGTLGTDDVILLGAWLKYIREAPTTTGQVFSATDLAADADNVVNFLAVFKNTRIKNEK
jgi:hypothetical protein